MLKTKKEAIQELEIIKEMIRPLNPPVFAFENSIKKSDFKILISVLLSSRTKDKVTEKASNNLFSYGNTPEEIGRLDVEEIEKLIYPVGFYKQKAIHIKKITKILKNKEIPNNQEELEELPGVGRKTANLVMSLAFNKPKITVDIHVFRISQRLNWVKSSNVYLDIEKSLEKLFEKSKWIEINQTLVGFGQTMCKAIKPQCKICELNSRCNYPKHQ